MKSKKHNQAMILAAGVGSRLDPLTSQIPKPLCPILGKPVMEHIIVLCREHGFTSLSANTNVMADKMEDYFGDGKKFGVNLNLVYEKQLTGVAGGIRSCHKYLTDEAILVIMGDALTDVDLTSLYEKHVESNCEVTVALKEVNDTTQYGVAVTDSSNKIISFQEKPKSHEAKSNLANTGMYFFNQSILREIPPESERLRFDVATDLFQKVMAKNISMQGIKINEYWADIGSLKQYLQSVMDVIYGKVTVKVDVPQFKFGWKENSAFVHESVNIEGKVFLGKNVKIGKNVRINGAVYIEDNCIIGDNSYISNSMIWAGSTLGKSVRVINSIIGNNCRVSEGTEMISNSVWAPNLEISADSKPAVVFS